MKSAKKIIVILGPTASGKTGLAVDLAYKFGGEIVSADSRQVYIGMDIGSGKDLPDYRIKIKNQKSKIKNILIPYHMIDVVKPNTEFSLGKYYKKATKAIQDIQKRGRLPIIAGGTGLWLQALVDGYDLSLAKPDKALREELEKLSVEQVYKRLEKLDKNFARNLNNSERHNKRRLIRYIEVKNTKAGKYENTKTRNNDYEYLIIGLKWPKEVLEKRIYTRLINRLEKQDMIEEVRRLHVEGVSWKRLESFGLEYRYLALYLQGKITYDKMVEDLFIASRQYAKRQNQWFRRWEKQGKKINWLEDKKEAEKLVKKFLK